MLGEGEISALPFARPGQIVTVLELPMELVLRILEMVVVTSSSQHPIFVRSKRPRKKASQASRNRVSARSKPGTAPLIQPAVTRACRLFRHEGLPLFYKENSFCFDIDSDRALHLVNDWLSALNPEHVLGLQVFCFGDLKSSLLRNRQGPGILPAWDATTAGLTALEGDGDDGEGLIVLELVAARWCSKVVLKPASRLDIYSFDELYEWAARIAIEPFRYVGGHQHGELVEGEAHA